MGDPARLATQQCREAAPAGGSAAARVQWRRAHRRRPAVWPWLYGHVPVDGTRDFGCSRFKGQGSRFNGQRLVAKTTMSNVFVVANCGVLVQLQAVRERWAGCKGSRSLRGPRDARYSSLRPGTPCAPVSHLWHIDNWRCNCRPRLAPAARCITAFLVRLRRHPWDLLLFVGLDASSTTLS